MSRNASNEGQKPRGQSRYGRAGIAQLTRRMYLELGQTATRLVDSNHDMHPFRGCWPTATESTMFVAVNQRLGKRLHIA
jgi:hypothetical protein